MLKKILQIYLPVLAFLLYTFSCQQNNKFPILCDMERVEGTHFVSQNLDVVSKSLSQSLEYSKSGKFSAKVDNENPYALGYTFENLEKGNEIIISIWEKTGLSKGYLKLVDENKNILTVKRSHKKKIESQWVLVTLSYILEKDYN